MDQLDSQSLEIIDQTANRSLLDEGVNLIKEANTTN